MSVGKIFLSHSSHDKDYVRYIAEHFGKDRCVYDEMCFEYGLKNLDEILRGLDSTSLFVFFISHNSLESDWVKKEITSAEENLLNNNSKLSQIFPIIIDETITHLDKRIPDVLRKGFGSYNLRFIKSKVIACKKIETQYMRQRFESDLEYQQKLLSFYGRSTEIKKFKDAFDGGQPIKCLIATGISGIGRRSYLTEVLKMTKIIPNYYEPSVLSLSRNDSITDLIMKFVELGFCEYSLDQVIALNSINEKIECLVEALSAIQFHKEHVIIYDDLCLIDTTGEVKYWFNKALEAVRGEITLSIASTATLNFTFLKKNQHFISIELSTLPYPEWNGLLRTYSQSIGVDFDSEDRAWFKDILTGYPPQVINCADLANEHGVAYVKKNSNILVKNFTGKISNMLDMAFGQEKREIGNSFLAFLSAYGTVPMTTIYEVLQLDDQYAEIFKILKSFTLCRLIGISKDYIEVNPVVCDYIQRADFSMPNKIEGYLKNKIDEFNTSLEKDIDSDDFESVKYYLKENIKMGKDIPKKFLYSTLFLNSIKELYDNVKYNKVIEIVSTLKINGSFSRFDSVAKNKIQRYYCLALAREIDEKFYDEVELYKGSQDIEKNIEEYNFLRGFMFRQNGEFDKALERYLVLVHDNPRHRGALRELVAVYRGLEDYESFKSFAYMNYIREPENPYQIQPYFESIIFNETRTQEELQHIEDIISTITLINSQKNITTYYEIQSLYSMYIEKDKLKAIKILNIGLEKFPDSSFIHRAMFDCYAFYNDINGMEKAIKLLKVSSEGHRTAQVTLKIREALFAAYQKKPKQFIQVNIQSIKGLTVEAKSKLLQKVENILANSK